MLIWDRVMILLLLTFMACNLPCFKAMNRSAVSRARCQAVRRRSFSNSAINRISSCISILVSSRREHIHQVCLTIVIRTQYFPEPIFPVTRRFCNEPGDISSIFLTTRLFSHCGSVCSFSGAAFWITLRRLSISCSPNCLRSSFVIPSFISVQF